MDRTDATPLDPADSGGSPAGWFGVWFGIGALYALALLGAMTIGIFVLPLAVVATVLAVRPRGGRAGRPGVISGAALPLLYVAYLNRGGPGTVCSAIAGGESCVDEWSPWPWLVAALILLALGVILFVRSRREATAV